LSLEDGYLLPILQQKVEAAACIRGRRRLREVDVPQTQLPPCNGRVRSRRRAAVDEVLSPVYHEAASGRSGDRGFPSGKIEESPHSTGHGAGEIPGRSNLSERATENNSRAAPSRLKLGNELRRAGSAARSW
jgi:hypothetical protein